MSIISDVSNLSEGAYKEHKLDQNFFEENVSNIFNILMTNETAEISKKVREDAIFLDDISKYIIEGIVGSKKRDVFSEKKEEEYKKFLDGHDVEKYGYEFKDRFIRYDRDKLHRARPREVFKAKEKIIIQRVSGGKQPIVCHLDKEQFYTYASTNNLILKEEVDFSEEYITALLNSKLINWYYSLNFSNMSDLTVNISKTFLEKISVRNKNEKLGIKSNVKKLMGNKNKLKKEKKSFLDWLSREWGHEIEDLSLKSHLKKYWKYDFDEILRIAKKNKSKIDANPSSRKFQDKLEEEWEKSINILKPLEEEIQETDNQIDAIVFDLYHLDKEEVETVLDSLETEEEVKEDILEKFRELE